MRRPGMGANISELWNLLMFGWGSRDPPGGGAPGNGVGGILPCWKAAAVTHKNEENKKQVPNQLNQDNYIKYAFV